MLSENKTVDQITVEPNTKTVFLRETIVIARDGEELSRSYHRTTLTSGADVSAWPEHVQRICVAAWA
jgi:hypothetical protein